LNQNRRRSYLSKHRDIIEYSVIVGFVGGSILFDHSLIALKDDILRLHDRVGNIAGRRYFDLAGVLGELASAIFADLMVMRLRAAVGTCDGAGRAGEADDLVLRIKFVEVVDIIDRVDELFLVRGADIAGGADSPIRQYQFGVSVTSIIR